MSRRSSILLERADRRLAAARRDIAAEDYESAVNRAYYAVFSAAKALLVQNDLEARTHKGVFTLLGRHFVHSGRLDKRFADIFRRTLDARLMADYAEGATLFEHEETLRLVDETEAFIAEMRHLMEPPSQVS